jgi:hypothetical protein
MANFEENKNDSDAHDAKFEKWMDNLLEKDKEVIFEDFYAHLRQNNGLLIELVEFWHYCWMFMTLEGKQYLQKIKDGEAVEDGEQYDKYHNYFMRWKIGNKNLMYNLYSYFYEILLDEEGDLMEFDEFLFGIWRFTTIEGGQFEIESEQELINNHNKIG